ncbi:MAG TPA: hypothetical protein PKD96_00170 [Candidatus Absconditabacterales bacterium]|nr:hypothetical protein [Candidatus Absconditabacterales bacterium]
MTTLIFFAYPSFTEIFFSSNGIFFGCSSAAIFYSEAMKLFADNHHLLSVQELESHKEFSRSFGNLSISTADKIVVGYHKKQPLFLNWKNVGAGMGVFFFISRKVFFLENVNVKFFVYGLSIYQIFDENQGKNFVGFYKISQERKNFLMKSVEKIAPEYSFQQEPSFSLQGKTDDLKSIFAELENADGAEKLSFLFGLAVAYGKRDTKGDSLLALKIFVPYTMEIRRFEDQIKNFFKSLNDELLIVTYDFVKDGFGEIIQVSITDWEILSQFGKWLSDYQIENVSQITRKETHARVKSQLISFLETEKVDSSLLDGGVLKLLEAD